MSAQPKPDAAAGGKSIAQIGREILSQLGVPDAGLSGGTLVVRSPIADRDGAHGNVCYRSLPESAFSLRARRSVV